MNEVLETKIKLLPENPGVYIMKNAQGQIIYVGKAKNLKNRVKQYFYNSGTKTAKVMAMVAEIADFDYIIVPSEVNALMLENNLIKKHKPHYNILLKDDKAYPFIKINMDREYPYLEFTRKFDRDHSKYFGPYMVGINIKDVLEVVNTTFGLRTCKTDFSDGKRHRSCLNYHIGRCSAPCIGNVSKEEYQERLNDAIDFLKGNDTKLLKILYDRMLQASEAEDYESALEWKRQYDTAQKIKRKQIASNPKDYNMDVFAIVEGEKCATISCLILRQGKILGGDNFRVQDGSISLYDSLSQFVLQYYQNNGMQVDEVIINLEDEDGALQAALSENINERAVVLTPKGGLRGNLIDMAEVNARDAQDRSDYLISRQDDGIPKALNRLSQALGIGYIRRMECYDNSNISGTNPVSSMVVFVDGKPAKKLYRRFSVKTVVGANDFATMKEILYRRFARYEEGEDESFKQFPDLIIIDGGKGQLSSSVEALSDIGVTVNICGLAKREEEIFVPDRSQPIILEKHSAEYHLVQRIRDEAHRFAITYHRNVRRKKQTESMLLSIKGVGKETVKLLFEKFNTLNDIKKASAEQLIAAGIRRAVAQNIVDFFSQQD